MAHRHCLAGDYLAFLQLNGSVKEQNMFHNYETEKITLPPEIVMHDDAFNVIL